MYRCITVFLVSIIALWLVGLGIFWITIPKKPTDLHTPTDAVVVLTGGAGRVQLGFSLMEQGLGKKLFISGVPPTVKIKDLAAVQKTPPKDSVKEATDLGHEAENTRENAQEVARWVINEKIQSVRLVTACFHIPRSILEIRKILPTLTIIPHPLEMNTMTKKSFFFLIQEFHKYMWARIFF